jgi:hypothetical protein
VSHNANLFLKAVGLIVLLLGVVQGIFGWSGFNRVHPWGASRRSGWFIAAGGAVLVVAAAAFSRP